MPSDPSSFNFPRLVIEQVSPAVDGGRYPAKRKVQDEVRVEADIFKDGHDLIAARVLYRAPGESVWRSVPMSYDYPSDRWWASFRVDRIGMWEFRVEAWPDAYRSWSEDLKKRIEAGQDVASELLEGAAILRRISIQQPEPARLRLAQAAKRLTDLGLPVSERITTALSPALLEDGYGPLGPDETTFYERTLSLLVEREQAQFSAWYELFPRSQSKVLGKHGTFSDVEDRIPELAALGFDVVYLPPIHPIGQTHRKGRDNSPDCQPGDVGSPWAIGAKEGGHDSVHPELGTIEDFNRLVATARDFGIEIALDIAFQCSPDHPWCTSHPEWFFIRPDGTIRYAENPPKKYEDIYPLNFWCSDRERLWTTCRDVFLFWLGHGVKIFRVDNPHTKPLSFWEWCLAEVRRVDPEVVFLSESFTRPKRMKSLAKVGFSQSYTYFTWKNSAFELREYFEELSRTEMVEYYRSNLFTNTPDILHEYLQLGGRSAFRVRLLLAATLAPAYGIYSGYELIENRAVAAGSEEYLHSEKYEIRQRNWNQFGNIKQDIAKLNRIRRENPALQRMDNLTFLKSEHEPILAYHKSANGNDLIMVVNLDPHHTHETMIHVPLEALQLKEDEMFDVEDLLTGVRHTWRGRRNYVRLDPTERIGHVLRIIKPHRS